MIKISVGIETQGLAFFIRVRVRANGHGPVVLWHERGAKAQSRQHQPHLMHSIHPQMFSYSVGDASEARLLLLRPHVARASEDGPDPSAPPTASPCPLEMPRARRRAL